MNILGQSHEKQLYGISPEQFCFALQWIQNLNFFIHGRNFLLKILPCDIHLLTQMSECSSKLSMEQEECNMMESKIKQHMQGINPFDV